MIFVVGNSRSGTTMLGRILNGSPEIFTFPSEIHFFGRIYEPSDKLVNYDTALNFTAKLYRVKELGYFSQHTLSRFYPASEALLHKLQPVEEKYDPFSIFSFFIQEAVVENGKIIGCDQTPRNLFYLKEILERYPEAKIINIIRDPRSVLMSQKNKWKRRFLGAKYITYFEALRSWANFHVFTISRLWNSSVDAYKRVSDNPRVYSVKYEELLIRPEAVIEDICAFLGVTYTPEMKNISIIGSSSRRDMEVRGIDSSRLNSWKNEEGLSNTEVSLCEKITNGNLLLNGYEPSLLKPSVPGILYQYFIFPFKLVLSVALNLGRNKNIVATIKRRLLK